MRWLAVLLVLSACTHTSGFIGPDGSTYYESTCNGGAQTMADCMNAAANQCGGAYDVLDGSEGTTGYVTTQNGTYGNGQYRGNGTTVAVVKRSLRYKCKQAPTPAH